MERKPKRRTRERILETALQLFNEQGEATVSTAAIAERMGISAGNLYYHFASKEKIVAALFANFRREMEATLAAPSGRPAHAEDVWLFLHLLFEAIWKYRFLYRDLTDIAARHRTIAGPLRRLIRQKSDAAGAILRALVAAGEMDATEAQIGSLATTMTIVACYWLSFSAATEGRDVAVGPTLARGAFHVISLAAPYLAPRERMLFEQLAQRYLH
ncbi:MAG TPA: TetR/AcrR family transcriptional regulator [Burkholderiaceae bacterium]|nr:TetR/AcrR family transcriptional regulator [Burkholderiaceae bacterium]